MSPFSAQLQSDLFTYLGSSQWECFARGMAGNEETYETESGRAAYEAGKRARAELSGKGVQ